MVCLSLWYIYLYQLIQSGECEVVNHTTKECCRINFKPYSYFSGDIPRKVSSTSLPSLVQSLMPLL